MTYRIISTTDGKFVGKTVSDISAVELEVGEIFRADRAPVEISDTQVRVCNSNYCIDLERVANG